MRSSMTPWVYIGMNVARTVSSRITPISSPLRRPMAIISTPMTMAMASMSETTKPLMAVSTAWAWW